MKLLYVNTSVVLLGQDYSPGIFTPDFLRTIRVAKKSWEFQESPIVSPVAAILKYSHGLILFVHPQQLQIVDGNPPANIRDSQIGKIVTTILKHLPYARHTAVGINISAIIEDANAINILRNLFIKDGVWEEQDLSGVTITFAYHQNDTTLNLTFGSGGARLAGEAEDRKGITISANYHSNIDPAITLDASAREVMATIKRIAEREENFVERISKIFPLE